MTNQNQRNQGQECESAPKPEQKLQNRQSNSRRQQSASADPQHMDREDEERKVLRRLDRQLARDGK